MYLCFIQVREGYDTKFSDSFVTFEFEGQLDYEFAILFVPRDSNTCI